MKRIIKAVFAVVFCILITAMPICAESVDYVQRAADSLAEMAGADKGHLLADQEMMPAGSSVSDWAAMAFAMGGVSEDYDTYLKALEKHVTDAYASMGCLDTVKATEYHRIALTVLALGGNPREFGTDKEGKPVDLIADGTYNFAGELGRQGLNASIFALITLDAGNYQVPEDAKYSREDFLQSICDAQEPDGGFGLAPGSSNTDITSMALQALAPYSEKKSEIIDKAIKYLASVQNENGGFSAFGDESLETSAQALIAVCSLGMDPEKVLTAGEANLITSMDKFLMEDGTYIHAPSDAESNIMSTEQALLARIAVDRFRSGGPRIYDFTEVKSISTEESNNNTWIYVVAGAAGAAIIIVAVLKRRNHAEKNR